VRHERQSSWSSFVAALAVSYGPVGCGGSTSRHGDAGGFDAGARDAAAADAGDRDARTSADAAGQEDGSTADADAGADACLAALVPLTWNVEVLDDNAATPDLDINPGLLAVAVDAEGRPYVAYSGRGRSDPPAPIHFAARDAGAWSALGSPESAGGGNCCSHGSLAVDGEGVTHLSFASLVDPFVTHLHYTRHEQGVWTEAPEPDPAGFDTATIDLAVGADGAASVAILGLDVVENVGLQRVGSFSGLDWSYHDLDDQPVETVAIAVDGEGARYLAYPGAGVGPDPAPRPLQLASDGSGAWSSVALTEPYFFDRNALAVTRRGVIHVCTDDSEARDLRCLECSDGECATRTIDESSSDWPSLVADSWDRAHLTYEIWDPDAREKHVRYAQLVGEVWLAEDVDVQLALSDPQIAVGRDGLAHVVYWASTEVGGAMQVRHAWAETCEPQ